METAMNYLPPLGNVRVLLVCFTGIAFSSLETWPVSELKVASGKPKRNIAVNESHRNRRKRRIVKSPDHSNKCRPGGLQFFFFLLE